MPDRVYDVIVVGAGPGGTSVATFLARRGISTLVLDRADFPRDKVCGDGLTPQAIYWLDRLGCVGDVLAETKACIKDCDLYMDGRLLLTGGFAKGTAYPDFAILLDRRRFDNILLQNARRAGARFEGGRTVRDVELDRDGARVITEDGGRRAEYRGRIVIGADGVSSAVSRHLGNTLKDGVMAISLRAYYDGVECEGSQIKVYFDRGFFPGYGWLFVDDDGFANVGLGYAHDKGFPLLANLRETFLAFVERDLGHMLRKSDQCGRISGGAAAFYRPKRIFGDRVLLVGDAANQADPAERRRHPQGDGGRRAGGGGGRLRARGRRLLEPHARGLRAPVAGGFRDRLEDGGVLPRGGEEPGPARFLPLPPDADRLADDTGSALPGVRKRGLQRDDLAERVPVAARAVPGVPEEPRDLAGAPATNGEVSRPARRGSRAARSGASRSPPRAWRAAPSGTSTGGSRSR